MKRTMKISAALFLTLTGFACTPKNNGMDKNRTEPQSQTVPDGTTTTTTTTTPTTTTTTNSMNQAVPATNCPDPMAPGYDATKVDPACPRPGSDVPPPATPTDPTRPTTP